jgi:hypothetical protein
VLAERDIVLGPDTERALTFIETVRGRLVQNYISAFDTLKTIEQKVFGQNSFFRLHPSSVSPSGMASTIGSSAVFNFPAADDMDIY